MIYTGVGSAYWGFLVRYGLKINPWFGIGAQVTPSFNLNDSFKYSYTTGAIYMNGQITKDGKLFWCSNTWFGLNKDADNTYTNWEYLGYTFKAGKNSITPMIGVIHSWKFDQDVDLAVGAYYSIGKFNIYLWGNDFFKDSPRIVAGVESRGAHAHRDLEQLIIAASGSFTVTLDDGKSKRSFFLNRPYQGLYVKPGLWRDLEDFSSGAVCMVLASEVYQKADYIRNYDEFLVFRKDSEE